MSSILLCTAWRRVWTAPCRSLTLQHAPFITTFTAGKHRESPIVMTLSYESNNTWSEYIPCNRFPSIFVKWCLHRADSWFSSTNTSFKCLVRGSTVCPKIQILFTIQQNIHKIVKKVTGNGWKNNLVNSNFYWLMQQIQLWSSQLLNTKYYLLYRK